MDRDQIQQIHNRPNWAGKVRELILIQMNIEDKDEADIYVWKKLIQPTDFVILSHLNNWHCSSRGPQVEKGKVLKASH